MMSKREKLSRKGGWEDDGVTILNRQSFTKKVAFEWRPKGSKRVNHVDSRKKHSKQRAQLVQRSWGRSVPGVIKIK